MATKKKTATKKATKATKKTTSKRPVKPVPRGYRTVTATFNQDDASALIAFCKKAFGAKLKDKMMGPHRKIMHAEVEIGDSIIMVSDAVQAPARPGGVFLYVPDVDKTLAKAVKAGATVVVPAQDMFWGDRFAQVVDPQGNSWALGTRIENVRPDEVKRRLKVAMKEMVKGAG